MAKELEGGDIIAFWSIIGGGIIEEDYNETGMAGRHRIFNQ